MLDATLQVMKPYDMIPRDFSYDMRWSPSGSITITSDYSDPLVSKRFIETISGMFGPVTNEKYVLDTKNKKILEIKRKSLEDWLSNKVSVILMILYILFATVVLKGINLEVGVILLLLLFLGPYLIWVA